MNDFIFFSLKLLYQRLKKEEVKENAMNFSAELFGPLLKIGNRYCCKMN